MNKEFKLVGGISLLYIFTFLLQFTQNVFWSKTFILLTFFTGVYLLNAIFSKCLFKKKQERDKFELEFMIPILGGIITGIVASFYLTEKISNGIEIIYHLAILLFIFAVFIAAKIKKKV